MTFPRPPESFKFVFAEVRGEPKETIRAASPGPRLTKAGSFRVVKSVSWLGSRASGSEPDVLKPVATGVEVARDPPGEPPVVVLAAPEVVDECTTVTRLVKTLVTWRFRGALAVEFVPVLGLGVTLVFADVVGIPLVTLGPWAVCIAAFTIASTSSRLTLLPAGAASLLSTASFVGQKTTLSGGGDWASGCRWRNS